MARGFGRTCAEFGGLVGHIYRVVILPVAKGHLQDGHPAGQSAAKVLI